MAEVVQLPQPVTTTQSYGGCRLRGAAEAGEAAAASPLDLMLGVGLGDSHNSMETVRPMARADTGR